MRISHASFRFHVLSAIAALAPSACGGGSRPASPTPRAVVAIPGEPREQTADEQVAHALNRLAFGPRPGDLQRVRALGVDRWISQQLEPERIADSATIALVAHAYPLMQRRGEDLYRDYPPPNLLRNQLRRAGDSLTRDDSLKLRDAQRGAQRIVAELQSQKVARAVVSERQLQEVMVDFWENHFNLFLGKGQPARYQIVDFERDVIRPNALGNFRVLLGAVAKSPAMLFYLDNWQSVADSTHETLLTRRMGAGRRPQAALRRGLNENYARELMELHTLGVDGGYSQQDVINVARALTGWSLDDPRRGGGFLFRPAFHDADEKLILGHKLAAGRGIEDGEDVLDIVARHPSTARFIATKLVRRFVSDSADPVLVARVAEAFSTTGGNIRESLRVLFASPEFWSRTAYRSKVKSPFETVVSALRAVNAAADTTPRSAGLIAALGQPLFGHQAPNGWPEIGREWMNTGAILGRINFGLAVAAGRVPGARVSALPNAAALLSAPREQQVDAVVASFFAGAVSSDTRAVLMSGSNPLADVARAAADTASDRMSMSDDEPAMMPNGGQPNRRPDLRGGQLLRQVPPLTGLNQIVGLAIGAPEFQRR